MPHTLIRDILPVDTGIPPEAPPQKKTKAPKKKIVGFHFTSSRLKLIVFLVFFYTASLFILESFSQTIITLSLRNETLEINISQLVGSKSDLPVETVIFEEEIEGQSKATQMKDFSERSSGRVVVYNAYSSAPQTLVADTRFADPDGRIYRIQKSIVVPGAEIVDGKIEPSSIEVEVEAERPGEEYNIGLTDWTIPGFKGSIKYEKFYARSKMPMTGGFVGQANVVSEEEAESLVRSLQDKLRQKLSSRIAPEVPEEFFIPEGAAGYEFEIKNIEPPKGARADEFKLALSGRLKVAFLRKKDVVNKILSGYRADPDFGKIGINNFEELAFKAGNLNFDARSMTLQIAGSARVVWDVDEDILSADLVAAEDSQKRLDIFQKYPQIRMAAITYKPSWWRIFPKSADKIKVLKSF